MDDYDRLIKDPHALEKINNKIKLEDFMKKLKTGDIIFSRSDTLMGKIIQFSGHCVWSHISICVEKNKKIHWCESTNSKAFDNKDGVKVWEMEPRLSQMLGNDCRTFLIFGVASLRRRNKTDIINDGNPSQFSNLVLPTPTIKEDFSNSNSNSNSNFSSLGLLKNDTGSNEISDECSAKLVKFFDNENCKPYKKNTYTVLFFSWFDGFSSIGTTCCCYSKKYRRQENDKQPLWAMNKNDTTSYFCSELIAEALTRSDIMKVKETEIGGKKIKIPSSEWTVSDLADVEYLNNNLYNNFYYTEIVLYYVYK